jgi:hypothetical protein
MAETIKRLHYFNHQFLRAEDFTAEQEYHLGMRRHHNRLLHTYGIAEGLEVPDPPSGSTSVRVTEGIALDNLGREIILTEDFSLQLESFDANKAVYVTIEYNEEQSDPTDETGAEGDRRWKEEPKISATETKPNNLGARLILGRVKRSGKEVASIDRSERRVAGVAAGDLEVRSLTLTDPEVISAQWPSMRLGEPNRADIQGNLQIRGNLVVDGTIEGDLATTIKHSALNKDDGRNPHKTRAVDIGALPISGGTLTGPLELRGEAVFQGRQTIFTTQARFDGPSVFNGLATFNRQVNFRGGKNGYVVDRFVNASGKRIQTGDVVTLKGTPIRHFIGVNNKIPVAEVALVDKEDDRRIIGIVECEAIPEQGAPDKRVGPEDPTFIEDGGELLAVTLGVYAHCKVDATEASIEPGDLLASSSKPGCAKKATDPKIGSIIGKALEALKEGTGYIAVFVNIQ